MLIEIRTFVWAFVRLGGQNFDRRVSAIRNRGMAIGRNVEERIFARSAVLGGLVLIVEHMTQSSHPLRMGIIENSSGTDARGGRAK